jgi:tetratricopeptide (TPR) repeat protein
MEGQRKAKKYSASRILLKTLFLWLLLALLPTCSAVAQESSSVVIPRQSIAQVPSPLSLEVMPTLDVPIADSAQLFTIGGAVDVGVKYRFPRTVISILGGIQYAYAPVQAATSLSFAAAYAGAGVQMPLASWISLLGTATGGVYFASYNDFSKYTTFPYPSVNCGLGLRFSLAPSFGLAVAVRYKCCFASLTQSPMYQGLGAVLGVDVALGNLGGSVEMPTLELRPAFPVFYKHYDDHPIGSLQIKSNLKVPATDIRTQVYIKQYMDSPKVMDIPGTLAPGESKTIDLYALFTPNVLLITEGTKVACEITVSYKVEGQTYEDKKIETLTLWGRNAMTWDDNRKAAAYVTSKDPGVLNFARSVSSYIRSRENRSICDNLQAAIAFHEALDLYGLNYTPNPKTPYSEVSKQKAVIDFLQFPQETFQYKAGDCSDLSILYGSLFQAVGIDAAFITIPGHIFIAVDSGLTPEQAPKELIPESQFIAYKNKAWIPVEITSIHNGFMKAWELGAKEWAENNPSGQAGFYPIQEAWSVYQPVGLPGADVVISVPQSDSILRAYLNEVQKYLDVALAPAVTRLQDQIKASGAVTAMNGLGILYAKYGQTDKAEQEFKQVLALKPYLPAMLNLGHLYFTKGDWKNALAFYQQASGMDPNNGHALLALTRVYEEMQNYDGAKQSYERLKTIDPALANQFAFLGEGKEGATRAADEETQRKAILWETTD